MSDTADVDPPAEREDAQASEKYASVAITLAGAFWFVGESTSSGVQFCDEQGDQDGT